MQDLANPPTKFPEQSHNARGQSSILLGPNPHPAARTRTRPAPPTISTSRALLLQSLHIPQRQHIRCVVFVVKVHRLPALERSHDGGCEVPRARAVGVVDTAGDGERADGRHCRAVRQAWGGARRRVQLDEVACRTVCGLVVVVVGHLVGHLEVNLKVVVRSRGLSSSDDGATAICTRSVSADSAENEFNHCAASP